MSRKPKTEPFEELKKELKRGLGDLDDRTNGHQVAKKEIIVEEGWVPLPCADMTCPCRVLNKQDGPVPERCLKR